jgi:OOP family OmpA-OmpF porin
MAGKLMVKSVLPGLKGQLIDFGSIFASKFRRWFLDIIWGINGFNREVFMYAENLLGVTKNFLTPDIVNKFSSAIGESTEKTQKALKTVIPALLMGIVNKGQSKGGAEVLVNLVNKDGIEGERIPDYGNENYLTMGSDAVRGIFGNDLNNVVSKLGDSTGIQSSGIQKMLKIAAPIIMGFLGTKIKREGLSASGLSGFLGQQKSALNELIPNGLVGRFTGTESVISTRHGTTKEKSKPTFFMITLLALAVFAGLWWFTGQRDLSNIVSAPVKTIPITNNIAFLAVPTIDDLPAFLESRSSELPKAFHFVSLRFMSGTSELMFGSEIELDKIVVAMNKFPFSRARIEGYTDNLGTELDNIELSAMRAGIVKEELVRRGIDQSRIESVGMGSSKPLASNETELGREQNQRIEFVITQIE